MITVDDNIAYYGEHILHFHVLFIVLFFLSIVIIQTISWVDFDHFITFLHSDWLPNGINNGMEESTLSKDSKLVYLYWENPLLSHTANSGILVVILVL